MKLLVVDDEPLVRKAIKRVGEEKGFEVFSAENGEEAVKVWPEISPDLVFLDVLMPGLSGPQVLAEVKKEEKTVVILISAFSGEYDMEKARQIGADSFIAKPFKDIFAVLDKGQELIAQKRRDL